MVLLLRLYLPIDFEQLDLLWRDSFQMFGLYLHGLATLQLPQLL